ncbi:uncharacterized protein LOC129795479 isoform X1 [Lutzomyia longipalpis]|uniref:uncharacterized protein LOC129795479 isoform X1 n=1 Tax=Lutzomyia longipalpis TaxID=7200 RepID=UPI0024844928|nr:uncharacterized protein LOC129795479 isoform X1 [Lutzomyia longipalpis]
MDVPGAADTLQGVAIKTEEPDEGLVQVKREFPDDADGGVRADGGMKRKPAEDLVNISDDDDEEFAGFDDNGLSGGAVGRSLAANRSKRVRNSAPNSVLATTIKQELPDEEEMLPQGGSAKKTTPQRPTVKLDDPIYRKPFDYGWKRELVYRAVAGISKEKGEVYYFTPTSKKLRTRTEIQQNLTHDLTLDNFTFIKEPLGLGPEFEIIRNAKSNAATIKRASMANADSNPTPDSPLGKRIPKPKGPKGGSPPPASIRILNRSRTSASSPRSPFGRSMQVKEKEEVKIQAAKSPPPKGTTAATSAVTKAKGEPCTIQCVLAMGTIPQLQCRKCLCLYHHECVGAERGAALDARYICQGCHEEDKAKDQSTQGGSPTKAASSKATKKDASGNLVTWVPSTSVPKTRSQGKAAEATDDAPPQTIATIAGRKYIIVPRTNVLNISPPGEAATANGAPCGTEQEDSKKRKIEQQPIVQNSDILREAPANVGKIPNDTVRSTMPVGGGKNKKGGKGGATNAVAKGTSFNYSHYFRNVAVGYNVLLETFQYLKVKELLRASCVCRVWNQAANHPSLWRTVRMKNSQVNDWSGFANALRRHGTTGLDLRKMLAPSNSEEMWANFSRHIGIVDHLEAIDLCRCPSSVVESLFRTNTHLRILNAVTIKDDVVDLDGVENLERLEELRLKPENWVEIKKDLTPMRNLHCLRHLALTFVKQLGNAKVEVLGELTALESLEIGECNDISETLARQVLPKLTHLQRLRLEKGQMNCNTSAILAAVAPLESLTQLELVNFDIKSKFNEEIAQCVHIKKLLIIPTYISQSATTNNMILSGMIRLSQSLRCFTWVVTLELLRVTDLYVVQCDASMKKEKRVPDESIPILKPVPGILEDGVVTSGGTQCPDAQQVEIVPLSKVESILHTYLPDTFIKIVKAQFHTTWRLNLVEPTALP